MRYFISGPRVIGLRFGAIFSARELRAAFPMWLWRLPILALLGAVSFLAFSALFALVKML